MEFLTTPTGTIAIIDGKLPSADEWARVDREDALVNVLSMPGRSESLAALLPFAEYLSRLAVNSATCTDLRALEGMHRLERLLVGGVVSRPPRAEMLTSLRYFGGDPALMPGIVSLPTIVGLNIRWHPNVLDVVSDSSAELTLREAGQFTSLVGLARLRNLEGLTVHGARSLSLQGVGELAKLTSLTLETIKSVTDTSCVLAAPALRRLTLEDCSDVDHRDALLGFSGEVRVIGRHSFPPEFQSSAGPKWNFPPGRRT